ncbi:hypothetical protein KSP40_PGU005903 [Platanthera guangdongensis]|uniref:serine--tRNA ligase n=1 Tax=Platanthera guangdongensis TaxID=2320717 RepID=A0ABR2MZL7_9ASPA
MRARWLNRNSGFFRFRSTLPWPHRMLDIKLFCSDPDRILESGCQRQYELDSLRNDFNHMNKDGAQLKIEKQDAIKKIKSIDEKKRLITEKTKEVQRVKTVLETKLASVKNLVHDSVPISLDKADIMLLNAWGDKKMKGNLLNHVDVVENLGAADLKKGANVTGGRGCYWMGAAGSLKLALIDFCSDFLIKRKFELLQTTCFMKKDIMSKCAQLAQIDEEFYKVTGEGEDKYLTSTSELSLCAYYMDEVIDPTSLPLRYAGFSTCLRKEAGCPGPDKLGIFRLPESKNIEQFCITSPNENESWEMHEEMLLNCEKFYQELNLPYQVVSIVSGALNDVEAKKYVLEGWFPSSKMYRELASCSNCTDYRARRLGIRYGQKKNNEQTKQYVHMLNSTILETGRTICCILENYQEEDGVVVPEALQPYIYGSNSIDFLPFEN